MQCLPETDKVFFVHYQCNDFNKGSEIYNMHIYVQNEVLEFAGENEAEFIDEFCTAVNTFCQQGLIPVHWSQNRPYFGPTHIRKRYKELTGQEKDFSYTNAINLSEWLKDTYGDDYISTQYSNRPDRLADLNGFQGHSREISESPRIYPGARTLLIHKIYKRALNKTLITDKSERPVVRKQAMSSSLAAEPVLDNKKTFADYLLHQDKQAFAQALKNEFKSEKGRMISLLVHAMTEFQPMLISICKGDYKIFFETMAEFFNRDIGAYKTFIDYNTREKKNERELVLISERLKYLLEYLNKSNEMTE